MKRKAPLHFIFLLGLLNAFPAFSAEPDFYRNPFFDCNTPQTDVQRVICGNITLKSEDSNLGRSFQDLLKVLPLSERSALVKEQEDWLKKRDMQCAGDVPPHPQGRMGIQDPASQCINKMYEERSRVLDARYERAACPDPAVEVQKSCQEFNDADLPPDAKAAFRKAGCEGGAWSNAVDLNGDGSQEYTVCCGAPPHGPCSFVILGKRNEKWTVLSSTSADIIGFTPPCTHLTLLRSKHEGYHDLCQAPGTHLWQMSGGIYIPTEPKPSK